jgi:hypothetical protein
MSTTRLSYFTQVVTFSGQVSRTVNFTGAFAATPIIVATAGPDMNVNVWVSNISISGATINISTPASGDVQVIASGPKP